MAVKMYSFIVLCFSFTGIILAAYPSPNYYPNSVPNLSVSNQSPQFLVFPQGIYKLVNGTNTTEPFPKHNYIYGKKSPSDDLLLHTRVHKRVGRWSGYAAKEIIFPHPGSFFQYTLTQINATDKSENGTGGFLKILSGGVGHTNVMMVFRSQRNYPINFELDIYGFQKYFKRN